MPPSILHKKALMSASIWTLLVLFEPLFVFPRVTCMPTHLAPHQACLLQRLRTQNASFKTNTTTKVAPASPTLDLKLCKFLELFGEGIKIG